MKSFALLAILLILVTGCSVAQQPVVTNAVSGIQNLTLTQVDLQQLGVANETAFKELEQLDLRNGTNCRTEGEYADPSVVQYRICAYAIPEIDTHIVIELQRFPDSDALNGSYQYSSLHLFSSEGIISENTFGDQSLFRMNNEHDYGGQYNDPNVYYYHLWITKDLYMIHITSKGEDAMAKEYIANIGETILAKFA